MSVMLVWKGGNAGIKLRSHCKKDENEGSSWQKWLRNILLHSLWSKGWALKRMGLKNERTIKSRRQNNLVSSGIWDCLLANHISDCSSGKVSFISLLWFWSLSGVMGTMTEWFSCCMVGKYEAQLVVSGASEPRSQAYVNIVAVDSTPVILPPLPSSRTSPHLKLVFPLLLPSFSRIIVIISE